MFLKSDCWKSLAVVCGVAALLSSATASAESFTTLFGVVPNPGLPTVLAGEGELSAGVGEFPTEVVLNGLEQFTNFNVQNDVDGLLGGSSNQGQIIFLQNANFYVGGGQIFPGAPLGPDAPGAAPGTAGGPIAQQAISAAGQANLASLGIVDTNLEQEGLQTFNNRVFGVFGEGRSDITFDAEAEVTSITLQAGITVGREDEEGGFSGLSVGGNAAFGQSLPEGSHLADGDGTILVYTNEGLELSVSLADAVGDFVAGDDGTDFGLINQDFSFSVDSLAGDFITRIAIVNEASALNSAAFLSELTVTAGGLGVTGAVPEPASLSLLGLAALGLLRRRR